MKPHCPIVAALECLLAGIAYIGINTGACGAEEAQLQWPLVAFRDGATNTVFQPQLQSWDYATLKALSAVSIQPQGAEQPTLGTIQFVAETRIDRAERTVYLDQLRITQAYFPSAGPQTSTYLATLRSMLPGEVKSISLDHLEANLAILQARQRGITQPIKNDPPVILFSTRPALLICIDGPPVYRPVPNTSLERVLNTRALILRDASGKHYLHLFDGYVQAPNLQGPWAVALEVPADTATAEKQTVEARQVDLLTGQTNPETKQAPSLRTAPPPSVRVATVPTELIVIKGEPKWAPISPTQLLYITNTTSHVFKNPADQRIYALISGRWFRGRDLEGPWEFVSAKSLPREFAAIPDDSPKENVKASIPGTRQCAEAAIANAIPAMTQVDRKTAAMDPPPEYDGAPKVEPIQTTPLSYIVNCPTPVIKMEAREWYACQNGVWFAAEDAKGPWLVATNVPPVIYSIPASCPIHYVVYSRIYRYNDTSVWVGTTPGYYGTMVSPDGIIVYGTGYVYPPYLGQTIYVCYPVTYGYGCNSCWTPWAGWSFGFSVAWATDDDWYWWWYCPPAPYWGPYWYPCYGAYYNAYGGITAWGPYGWAGTTGYIYHQNGPWTGVSRAAAGYNAWTGNEWATSYGRAYNSTTGTRVVGQRGAVENVHTGNYAYGGRGAFYNENTGAAGAGRKVTVGNEDTGRQGTIGRGTIYNPNSGEAVRISGAKGESGGVVNVNGHVIAGKDGNYYRPDGQGGWEQITRPPASTTPAGSVRPAGQQVPRSQTQWAPVQPSPATQQQFQDLDNEFYARQMGAQRQQSFQMNRPAFNRGGGRRR